MSFNSICNNLQRVTELTPEATRRLFLETDPLLLEQALESVKTGDLKYINGIHRKVEAVFDPAQRGDRRILRMIRQIPDALTVDRLLTPENLTFLQGFINKEARHAALNPEESRVQLLFRNTSCHIKANGLLTVRSNKRSELDPILKQLFIKAMEASYKLDGEAAVGHYNAELFVARDYRSNIFSATYGMPLHHDFDYKDGLPNEMPKYLFLGMLSDRAGKWGWEGGDLLIQNEATGSLNNIPLQEKLPYLTYQYPLNEGICLRNRNVAHQCTDILSKRRSSDKLARDLLVVQLYPMDV